MQQCRCSVSEPQLGRTTLQLARSLKDLFQNKAANPEWSSSKRYTICSSLRTICSGMRQKYSGMTCVPVLGRTVLRKSNYSRLQKGSDFSRAWRPPKKKSKSINLKLTIYNKPRRLYYALAKHYRAWISLKLKYPSVRIRAKRQYRRWYSLWPPSGPPNITSYITTK